MVNINLKIFSKLQNTMKKLMKELYLEVVNSMEKFLLEVDLEMMLLSLSIVYVKIENYMTIKQDLEHLVMIY